MQVAFDLDNTIDAAPKQMQSMMSAFKAAGYKVVVLTGTENEVTETVWQAKANYLNELGCGACWTQLVVLAHGKNGPSEVKAEWCKDNDVDVLIDNSKDNARAAIAAGVPLVLVPWATRS